MNKIILFSLLLLQASLFGEVKLNSIFTSGAVLQRDVELPIYGTAKDGEEITVTFAGETQTTLAKDGKWKVFFNPQKAGGPFTIKVQGSNTIVLNELLMGDVWLCSGQSNMQYYFYQYYKKYPEIIGDKSKTYVNSQIRIVKTNAGGSSIPQDELVLNHQWKELNPDNIRFFSATAYYFGVNLQESINVPIGLIQSCLSATAIDLWIPTPVIHSNPLYKKDSDQYKKLLADFPAKNEIYQEDLKEWQKKHQVNDLALHKVPAAIRRTMPREPIGPNSTKLPSALYNKMIAPLHQFPIKGILWYQGEANANNFERVKAYESQLPDLIKSWRAGWGLGDLPFYWVQLAAYKNKVDKPQDDSWPWMRHTMDKVQGLVKNGAMACVIDVGMQKDIHPPYKKFAGDRLALLARKLTYNEDVVHQGPTYKSFAIKNNKILVAFENTGSGLKTKPLVLDNGKIKVDADKLYGFTVCGPEQKYHTAQARIVDASTIELWSDKVASPKHVRYAWYNFPLANLYNNEDLPTYPFRTDNFEPKKY
ncbi:sialate O-acetylesterase [Lentisphaera profundi]|uniref:Sialate O-acetylesterase n=1 Tax=Lentisphaera profundi TaxID=1658616 RepID=A0ABY7VWB8_9BACT|nr:sialate O-acetylesterase [Lentisphaera profundi]WDE97559.1 sialate O-acetylesterase [Lentisphaera profundi]